MKFKIVIISISFLSVFSIFSQTIITYSEYNSSLFGQKEDSIKCKQEYIGNLRNGKYSSWYSNNVLRCSGNFKNNQKVGTWKVYDRNGVLRVQMDFNKRGKAIFYKTWDNNANLIFEKYYNIELSQNYTLDFKKFTWKDSELIFLKKTNAYIENEKTNRKLFQNDYLKKELINLIDIDSVKVYKYDNSQNKFPLEEIDGKIYTANLKENKIEKFEIEIFYFLTTKNDFVQKQTVFVTPIYKNKKGELIKPYMIFLGKSKIISTLNNSIFWIYKEENINNEILTEYYKSDDEKYLSKKVFNDILEFEIESWIK